MGFCCYNQADFMIVIKRLAPNNHRNGNGVGSNQEVVFRGGFLVGVVGVRGLGRRPADYICCLVPQARLVAVAEIDAGRTTQMVSELEIEHSYSSFGATLERKDISVVS
jgi:hypothetical protein